MKLNLFVAGGESSAPPEPPIPVGLLLPKVDIIENSIGHPIEIQRLSILGGWRPSGNGVYGGVDADLKVNMGHGGRMG